MQVRVWSLRDEALQRRIAEAEAAAPCVAAAEAEAAAAAEVAALDPVKEDPQAYAKIKQAPFTHKSQAGISRAEIAYMFRLGRPANDLSKTGLTVHCFDGTEDWMQPWAPCKDGECIDAENTKEHIKWWSVSIINRRQHHTLTTSGLILNPHLNKVLCSWDSDFGSMQSGCKKHNVNPLPPDKLKDMLETSMSDDYAKWYGDANMYNEVLVNSTLFWDNLPKSVAAFVYFDDIDAVKAGVSSGDMRLPDKIVAATNYVKFLDHYKLKELDVPLLKINRTGDMTITDVSAGARAFIANHTYENYRKHHPYNKVIRTEDGPVIVNGSNGATQQQGLQDQFSNAGWNERVVSGDLITCHHLNAEQIIWGDRACSRRPIREVRRAEVAASPRPHSI